MSAKFLERDHKRRMEQIDLDHRSQRQLADLALIGGRGILQVWPNEVAAWSQALAVVTALDEAGVVFARMGSCSEDDAGEKP